MSDFQMLQATQKVTHVISVKLWSVDSSNLLAIVRSIAEQVSASSSSSRKWSDFTVSVMESLLESASISKVNPLTIEMGRKRNS